jgi:hypothetical protein
VTKLNLNIISSPKTVNEPLVYTFGLQATPIRPVAANARKVQNAFSFGQVAGFNGHYMQAKYETHMSFRLSPKDLDWTYPVAAARNYRGGDKPDPQRPLIMYLDRTWQRAPEDAREYNQDWRGWGDATRYTKPVRDCYAWYVNEWLRRGIMEGMYIDDAWIDPTKSLWHLDKNDNLSYKKDTGKASDYSDREWGFEFFDYRDMLKRIRWLFLDNQKTPLIVTHVTQTPYYPIFGFVDVMLEGEDRYLANDSEERDFIGTWGLARLRYANPAKWGVPVQWLPILNDQTARSAMPMERWHYQQTRSYLANLLLHDVSAPAGAVDAYQNDIRAAGCYSDAAKFMGYWEPQNPVAPVDTNLYASVYQLSRRLTVVLVNAQRRERVVEFSIDPAKVKALLGTDVFTLKDVDSATIPAMDAAVAALKSGVRMTTMDSAMTKGVGADDSAVGKMADGLLREIAVKEKKANDPDSVFEHHNFRYDKGVLRLRIQGNDYRLLQIVPGQ